MRNATHLLEKAAIKLSSLKPIMLPKNPDGLQCECTECIAYRERQSMKRQSMDILNPVFLEKDITRLREILSDLSSILRDYGKIR